MIKNKKSQMGHILSAPVVFILVALVMFGFIAIAAGISILHKPSPPQISNTAYPTNSFLLKELPASINNKEENYLIYYFIYLKLSGKLNEDDFKKSLNILNLKENECYYLFYEGASSPIPMFFEYSNLLNTLQFSVFKDKIKDKILTNRIKVNNEEKNIKEYFGSCQ